MEHNRLCCVLIVHGCLRWRNHSTCTETYIQARLEGQCSPVQAPLDYLGWWQDSECVTIAVSIGSDVPDSDINFDIDPTHMKLEVAGNTLLEGSLPQLAAIGNANVYVMRNEHTMMHYDLNDLSLHRALCTLYFEKHQTGSHWHELFAEDAVAMDTVAEVCVHKIPLSLWLLLLDHKLLL